MPKLQDLPVAGSRVGQRGIRKQPSRLLLLGLTLTALALAGCSSPQSDAAVDESPTSVKADSGRLDAVSIDELLPTDAEIEQRLRWSRVDSYEAPDFAALPDAQGMVDGLGGPMAIGVDCADDLLASKVMPVAPLGAEEVAAGKWSNEEGTSVRELWLERYPSADEAASQISHLPVMIAACPSLNFAGGDRTLTVIPTGLENATAFQAVDNYSWVVAHFENFVVQVKVGTGETEIGDAEALVQAQIDKLDLVARGDYK